MPLNTQRSGDEQCVHQRRLFMVLSPVALPYATLALTSLFRNVLERIHLSLITDSPSDKEILIEALDAISKSHDAGQHAWAVYSASDLDDREETQFSGLDHLRNFRRGHPCWRKITDPVLLSSDRQEMVLLDPDLYFPNRFRFEPTPETGVLLMWQKPCCLFPPEVVRVAMSASIPLAHHVDIGVGQWRFPIDLEWLDWLIRQLGSSNLPRSMHIEAIVWAALAMRIGGGYLNPRHWLCWHRTQLKRSLRKLGVSGARILHRERLAGIKCLHAGGEAKWWLPEADRLRPLDQNGEITASTYPEPFTELTPRQFYILQRNRRWLRHLGYYSLFR